MEKQTAFFQMEDNDESTIWPQLPEENRQKIESIFARIIIKYLSLSSKEVSSVEPKLSKNWMNMATKNHDKKSKI